MLKAIWDFFFYSCKHEWKIIDTDKITDVNYKKIGTKYHLHCDKCGNFKKVKV